MKLIKTLIYKFKSLPKVTKGIIVTTLVPVILFIGIFVYAISTVMIDFAFGTDVSKTVNNEEYQKKQEQLEIEKGKQEELEKENKKEEVELKEEQDKKDESKQNQDKKNESTTDTIKDSAKETSSVQKKEESKKEDKVSYDKLQQLYLDIESEMSYEEVLAKVQESGLPFSETKFSTSKAIKVAFEKGVTPQSHADSGDYVDISFKDDRNGNYVFGTIEYFNHKKFVTIFEYKDGTYWDFRHGEDKGYYINNYQTSLGDKSEKYIKASSKEEQLKYVINYTRDK